MENHPPADFPEGDESAVAPAFDSSDLYPQPLGKVGSLEEYLPVLFCFGLHKNTLSLAHGQQLCVSMPSSGVLIPDALHLSAGILKRGVSGVLSPSR